MNCHRGASVRSFLGRCVVCTLLQFVSCVLARIFVNQPRIFFGKIKQYWWKIHHFDRQFIYFSIKARFLKKTIVIFPILELQFFQFWWEAFSFYETEGDSKQPNRTPHPSRDRPTHNDRVHVSNTYIVWQSPQTNPSFHCRFQSLTLLPHAGGAWALAATQIYLSQRLVPTISVRGIKSSAAGEWTWKMSGGK